jgi:hypothetical protein
MALRIAWPEWLDSRQVRDICEAIRPGYARSRWHATHKALVRLVGLKLAERLGENRRPLAGRRPDGSYIMAPMARYRLLLRVEDLL